MIGEVQFDQNGKVKFTITMNEEYVKELLNELNMVHNNHVLLFGFEHIDNLRIELMGLLEYFNEKRMEGEREMKKDFFHEFLEEQLKNPEFKKAWKETEEEFQQMNKQIEKKMEEQKPTAEQVAWVFQRLNEHLQEGGSFRYLIYNRMGFDEGDYWLLYSAGGMNISNAIFDSRKMNGLEE